MCLINDVEILQIWNRWSRKECNKTQRIDNKVWVLTNVPVTVYVKSNQINNIKIKHTYFKPFVNIVVYCWITSMSH